MFIKGPVPLDWLAPVLSLPGKGILAVCLALWFKRGLERSVGGLTLSGDDLRLFGVSRWTYYRSLERLEELGLVSVVRKPGAKRSVTLLQTERQEDK